MTRVIFDGVTKLYSGSGSGAPAVSNLNLEIEDEEFLVLVGPSGCGKSTAMRMVAGLEEISEGRIIIGDRVVNDLPPKDRNVAMVFQSYALYPTMTVAENIPFPLRMRKLGKAEAHRQVEEVARLLQIEPLLGRRPRELSGGQRQRVAIGRALVRDPKLFLFDEPLSNLDASLRTDLRTELKRLHQKIRRTMVYVTHDQIEAMTLATKIVIMSKGAVLQIGSPAEIYHDPVNLFVARFIGSPAMSLLKGRIAPAGTAHRVILDLTAAGEVDLPTVKRLPANGAADVLLGIRPEHIRITDAKDARLTACVDLVEPTGAEDIVTLKVDDQTMIVRRPAGELAQGTQIGIDLARDKVMVFEPSSGHRLL